ncbi:MAG: succinylglutamate-semialdehyde dehydrogenase [Candidatus Caenarcaniphilales bacterium]|nr:succinylglutamate-semialdehyde dehydrogenase [Candidatus Caenarcaniphilales bacterium]
MFESVNPSNNEIIWQGAEASEAEVDLAVRKARKAFPEWAKLSMEERATFIEKFLELVKEDKEELAKTLSDETGKVIWEARTEITAMVNKFAISKEAYETRTGITNKGLSYTRHKPHGVIAVFGPYNFPAHIPNGHIVPALLAGNTIVFKPSELTPLISEKVYQLWIKSGLPEGVLNLVQGKANTGIALSKHKDIDGLFFTGSSKTGLILHKQFADTPNKILALELGGNNPLIVNEVKDIEAAVYLTIQSAFISSGQRCTCARRLILVDTPESQKFLDLLVASSKNIRVGSASDETAFMGPVISEAQASKLLKTQDTLVKKGAKPLLEMNSLSELGSEAFLSPGIIDCTDIDTEDEEFFGPLLQVKLVKDFDAAIAEANNTKYGLSAGLLSDSKELYDQFYYGVKAGLINWNNQLTGASSSAPFGGTGLSGNHKPSAFYAADYCAYPVASMESDSISLPEKLAPGIKLEVLSKNG